MQYTAVTLLAAALAGSAAAQNATVTFAGFANKTSCKTTPCGARFL